MTQRTAGIIGLGLIGGSIARDLAARGITVFGADRSAATLTAAIDEGVVTATLGRDLERTPEVDWLIIAVPVDRAPDILQRVRPLVSDVPLITDAGSTKRSIISAARSLGLAARFVGSHPLAGSHDAGWHASRTDLFAGARVFLCPAIAHDAETPVTEAADPESDYALAALAHARDLWSLCGARTELIAPEQHDRLLAWTSHLPQIASSALAATIDAARLDPRAAGPGGRAMLRLAASDPDLWAAILADNADNVLDAVIGLEASLAQFRLALTGAPQPHRLVDLLGTARRALTG